MIKDSELSRLRPSYSVNNSLNTSCGVYLLIVGDKLFIGKCYKSFAFTFINSLKLLLNNKYTCKILQEKFNQVKNVWALPLISISMFSDSNSVTVIDTLYNLLMNSTNVEFAGHNRYKEVDLNIIKAFSINAPKLLKTTEDCIATLWCLNDFLSFHKAITVDNFKSRLKRRLRRLNRRIFLYHLVLDKIS